MASYGLMGNGKFAMHNLKGIHFGSYWMRENDIVYLMAQDLKELCNLTTIDTLIYNKNKEHWFREDYSYGCKSPIRWLNEQKVIDLIKVEKPNFVIVNSGGMSFTSETIRCLKDYNVVTMGISLSDPDVFPCNGRIYSEYYDLFYTNSTYALNNLYSKKTNIKLLPFAASTKLHKPLPTSKKKYDVVVVGHARPDRVKVIKKLKKYFNVGLFGEGWGDGCKSVNGEDHVRAINAGKMYLSFSGTIAGYINMKVGVFEAVACKSCVVTQIFDEMESFFKYGLDILGYQDDDMLINLINCYTKNDRLRNWIVNNSYEKLIKEHTWTKRWVAVLNDIKKIQTG